MSDQSGDKVKREQQFRLRAAKTVFKAARRLNFFQFPTNIEVGQAVQYEINKADTQDNESLETVFDSLTNQLIEHFYEGETRANITKSIHPRILSNVRDLWRHRKTQLARPDAKVKIGRWNKLTIDEYICRNLSLCLDHQNLSVVGTN